MDERVDGRTLRYRGRRAELLDSVLESVLDLGVSDLSMRRLAEAVGVSHVTLVHHFGTKEQLISEVLEEIRRRTPLPSAAAEDVLADLWDRWTAPESRPVFRLLFEAYGLALAHPDRYRRFLDHVVDDWITAISAFARAEGCPDEEAPAFATFVLAQVRGLQLDLLTTGDCGRLDGAVAMLLDVVAARRAQWGGGGPELMTGRPRTASDRP